MTTRRARKLLRQLTTDEVRERCHLAEGHIRVLQTIGLGRPVKNAKLALDAIALMMTFSQPKPAQQLDVRQAVIQVMDPYRANPALPPAASVPALPAPEPGPAAPALPGPPPPGAPAKQENP